MSLPTALVGAALFVAGGLGPLPESEAAIFAASPEDPAPEVRGGMNKRLSNRHYVVGNEYFLHAFYEDVKDRGGGYMGVGSDQAYLFIGWQKAELAWFVDYDPSVKTTHLMYAALFSEAESPKDLYNLFEAENIGRAEAAIGRRYEGKEARELKAFYRRYRKLVRLRLWHVRKAMRQAKVPSYLTDQDTFDVVRDLVESDRIRRMTVDLTRNKGVRGIGDAAIELGVPIRVVYLSNAEQYWKTYPEQFRDNMLALPADEESLLLRTKVYTKIADYQYLVQPFENYRAWLCADSTNSVEDIYGDLPRPRPDEINFVRLDREPPA